MAILEVEHRGFYWREPYDHELPPIPAVTIQAFDTGDETLYVLRRPGKEPVTAYWPQPLLDIAPDAVRIATVGETPRSGIIASIVHNPFFGEWDKRLEESISLRATRQAEKAERKQLKKRAEELRIWRLARPRRFLRTGRSHNHSARLQEAEIRAIQRRHYTGMESLRSICREMYEAKGYKSEKTMLNTLCDTLTAYGLRKRSPAEMTAHSNRLRSMRLPGETKDEFRARRRRETGEIRGVICSAIKTLPGKGRGEQCKRPAQEGSEYCMNHDPARAQERAEILRHARSARAD